MERVAVDFWRWPRRSTSTVSYELPRLLFHCCFFGKLRRGSTHSEASDGSHENERPSERPVCLEGHRWHHSDDDLVLSYARIAATIRPELSLSIPRFERDLHHLARSGRPEGKAKHATGDWRIADQHRDCARFAELTTASYGGRSSATPGSRSSPLQNSRACQQRPKLFKCSQINSSNFLWIG